MKTYADIDQSKKLMEILLFKSADMSYHKVSIDIFNYSLKAFILKPLSGDIPCWSLSALLEIMPRYIESDDDRCFFFGIWKTQNLDVLISYTNEHSDEVAAQFAAKEPIDAAVEMIYWLKENNYV